tara:strand:+ start:36 stop:506 length:471 start_codon:yes stop_codon:yes gene_type:complete
MDYSLNDEWCLWYHSSKNSSWKNESYKNIFNFNNLCDVKFINSLEYDYLKVGMYFIMRKNIFPTWEDPENRKGATISYKVYDTLALEKWNYIINGILTNNIYIDDNIINGLSIVPKKSYHIIKIWVKRMDKNILKNLHINDNFLSKSKTFVKKNIT